MVLIFVVVVCCVRAKSCVLAVREARSESMFVALECTAGV